MKTKFQVSSEIAFSDKSDIYYIEYKKWFKWHKLKCDNEFICFVYKEQANNIVKALNQAKL